MARAKLDRIDRKILRDLQKNGRITNVELAKNAGISAPPCLRRVRALEDSGYIQSYHAKINNSAMGYTVTVFASVKLNSQKESDLRVFEEEIKKSELVRECFLLAGDVDYLLKIVAKDWDAYQDFHSNVLTKAPAVESVKSSLTMKELKSVPGVPIEE